MAVKKHQGQANLLYPRPLQPQYLRADKLWHHIKMPVDKTCMALGTWGDLKKSHV
ncbi:hypothetical protein PAXRUDRAFT_825476, partial [Paxillus rubicundulus Ve08.2h10]